MHTHFNLLRAIAEYLLQSRLLLLVDAQVVLILERDPLRRVIAPLDFVGRLPRLRALVALLLVSVVLDGEKDIRVVGVALAPPSVLGGGLGAPCLHQRHDVVYIDVLRIRRIGLLGVGSEPGA